MLKQLEALLALKPRIVVPSHGPLSDVRDLQNMVDYILLARQKVRVMMDRGLGLPEIVKGFDMNDYKGWDRASHFDWMAETIWRELSGLGPIVTKSAERDVSGVVTKVAEAGRNLTLAAQGREIRLRVSSGTNIEGVADRTQLREGMKVTATYIEPENFNAALGFDLVELGVQP
jgi:hypothetical protein